MVRRPVRRRVSPRRSCRWILPPLFFLLFLLVGPTAATSSQLPAPEEGPPAGLADDPTVYLVTVGRGPAVWERFGHNLLWIHDPERGIDEAYNYGLFSFEQENFLLRFIRGEMLYWMAGEPNVSGLLSAYSRTGRRIEIQELDLAPEAVRELHEFLEWNELPENRFYGYDYYRDNCSTRVRDALDRVLDGRLEAWARARITDASYRDQTLRLSDGLFWVSAGMHFGLGPSVDDPLSAWESMFIPMELRDHLRSFPTRPNAGTSIVVRQWVFAPGSLPAAPTETPRWIGGFLVVGLLASLVVAGGAALASRAREARPWLRRTVFGVAIPWLLVVGGMGTLIALLWAFTDHVGTHGNVNLLYATPFHLALAVLWPLSRRREWARRTALRAAGLIAALAVLGLALEALSLPDQVNGEFLVLLVPSNLALAWAVWKTEAP